MIAPVLHFGVRRANLSTFRKCIHGHALNFVGVSVINLRWRYTRSFSSTPKVSADMIEEKIFPTEKIRNIAIIAHGTCLVLPCSTLQLFMYSTVDHGKTTLVDQLLRQSGTIKQLTEVEQAQFALASTATTTADASIED